MTNREELRAAILAQKHSQSAKAFFEKYGKTCAEVTDKAAQEYLSILPLVREMVEARNTATLGPWYLMDKLEEVGAPKDSVEVWIDTGLTLAIMGSAYHEDGEKKRNAKFITTAANNTNAIAKILGE